MLHYLALAREFRNQHLYQKAEAALKLALEKSPHHPTVLTTLANLYMKMGFWDQALKILNQLIRQHPRLKSARFLRGKLYQRWHQSARAMEDFQQALTGSQRDVPILKRLIPLLLERKQLDVVHQLIQRYRPLLQQPAQILEWEASLLLKKGRLQEAVEKMRQAVMRLPHNRYLLKKYLATLIQASDRHPLPAYQSLKTFVPQLAELALDELKELEIAFLLKRGDQEAALYELNTFLDQHPDDFYHRERRAFLLLKMGREKEGIEELVYLFRQRPENVHIRNKLEHYFMETQQLVRWKSILKEVLMTTGGHGGLFGYLRPSQQFTDWLAYSRLNITDYQKQIKKLPVAFPVLADPTYSKLPFYALETLVHQLALHDRFPTPQALWEFLRREKEKKGHVPPFQLEDLEMAYPVWLFAIQFYYLFKDAGELTPRFVPSLFQRQQFAVILEKGGVQVYVDVGHLILPDRRKRKRLIQKGKYWVYRWPGDFPVTTRIRHIPFFSVEQARQAVREIINGIEATGVGSGAAS